MTDNLQKCRESIVNSVNEIFETMIFMEVENIEGPQSEAGAASNISSMIGLGGDMRGMMAVHFPEKLALEVTESFLGMEVAEIDDDVKDAIGEVANMAAGGVKLFFTEIGVNTELAIPSTIVGKSYRTSGLAGAEKVDVVFKCGSGTFRVELKYIVNAKTINFISHSADTISSGCSIDIILPYPVISK